MLHLRSSAVRAPRLAVALALLLLLPTVVSATDTAGAEPGRDAAAYSEAYGTSLAEANRRLAEQVLAGELSADLETRAYSDWFAGLWIVHAPEFGVVVASTRGDPPGLDSAVSAAGLADAVKLVVVERSLTELESLANAARAVDRDAHVDVDVPANKVVIHAQSPTEWLAAAAPRGLALTDGLDVREGELRVRATATLYGGMQMVRCTSGFSARYIGAVSIWTNKDGVVTAGHCTDGGQTVNGHSVPFAQEEYTGSHDEQWHYNTAHTFPNTIYDSLSPAPYTRSITSRTFRSNQALESFVCKYGRTTGYTCGELVSKTSLGDVPNSNQTYMVVQRISGSADMSTGGDSGGPVFVNSSAWGIVHGCLTLNPSCDFNDNNFIYTAINYVEGGLDVRIKTSP